MIPERDQLGRFQKGIAYQLGYVHSQKSKQKMRKVKLGNKLSAAHKKAIGDATRGKHHSEEAKRKMSEWHMGKKHSIETRHKMSEVFKYRNWSGENHPQWIKDRTQLAKKQKRNDYAYQNWRRLVWQRDNWKCKIENTDCNGRIVAHHILPWRDFVELRYEVNNGITLCQFHHPRKRIDEIKFVPTFQELVNK